jgi:hypothetical protein
VFGLRDNEKEPPQALFFAFICRQLVTKEVNDMINDALVSSPFVCLLISVLLAFNCWTVEIVLI